MIFQPVTPILVKVVDAPSRETSVADILIGAVGFVGFVLLAAAVIGVAAGAIFFQVRRLRRERHAFGDSAALNLSATAAPPRTPTSTK